MNFVKYLAGVFLLLSGAAWAQGFVARTLDKPVPGGIAVVALGESAQAPTVKYDGSPVLVMRDSDGQWVAVAGIDLKTPPGQHSLDARMNGQARSISFRVNEKRYKEQ